MVQEQWKPIAGYEGVYEVSNFGKVRSLDRTENWKHTTRYRKGRYLKQMVVCGYCQLELKKNSKGKGFYVHRLVGQAFIANDYAKPKINHIDNNPLNNRVDNLEWCTQSENYNHSKAQGRNSHGEKHGKSKLTDSAVKVIRTVNISTTTLADMFGVSYSTIESARKGKTWQHVA